MRAGTTPAVGARTTQGHRTLRYLRHSVAWYPFILVNAVVFAVFNLVPWISMIEISLRDTDLLSRNEFVGLSNYVTLVQDQLLRRALTNTFAYLLMYVPAVLAVSLFVAILVNRKLVGVKLFRAAYFLPNVTSIAVLSLIFRRFLSPRADGPVNYLLGLLGIAPQPFLLSVTQALPSLAGIALWETFGYFMVIWLAGLQGIPSELYDAAYVDGASGWKLHRHVTIPMLRPTAAFIVVISTIGALQVFGSIYIMTGGGPVYATTTVVYHIYQQAFNFGRFGYSSTISIVLFLMILVITFIQGRYLRFGEEVY
ncbi:MAG: sugar ABC transporter permease [Anaerolineae bacterium]|nr:sugar ABC transporter permease [Anaerolineae bacterium]